MSFTPANDINVLQASDASVVGAGDGNDRYVLSTSQLSDGQRIRISDTSGLNTLQLVGGLAITSSRVTNTALLLTLSNAAEITLLGANQFAYLTGGDPVSGNGGTLQDFNTFVTQTLGTTVPNGNTPNNGGAVTINPNGGNTVGQGLNLTVATITGTNSSTETDMGAQPLSYTLSLSAPPTNTVTINVSLLPGNSATQGDDFNILTQSIVFAANQTSRTLNLAEIIGDIKTEPTETFTLRFTSPQITSPVDLTITILDNDIPAFPFLTTANDTLNGSQANDVFSGVVDANSSANTFSNLDQLNGNSGTDTLRLVLNNSFGDVASTAFRQNPSDSQGFVRNFEVLDLFAGSSLGGSGITFNAANIGGVTTINWTAVNNDLAVSNLGQATSSVGINGLASGKKVTLAHTLPTTDGIDNLLNVSLQNSGGSSNTSSGVQIISSGISYETLALQLTGSNTLEIGGNSASVGTSQIIASGSGSLKLSGLTSSVKQIDGSTLTTGSLDLELTDLADQSATVTVRGGGGADRLIASAVTGNTKSVFIDGGAGNDQVTGSTNGVNKLNGGNGNDTLMGGTASDSLSGGSGADLLMSSVGNDTFIFASRFETKGAGYTANSSNLNDIDQTDFTPNSGMNNDMTNEKIMLGLGNGAFFDGGSFSSSTVARVLNFSLLQANSFSELFANLQTSSVATGIATLGIFAPLGSNSQTASIYGVNVDQGALAGRYVVINDGNADLTADDAIIKIAGMQAGLAPNIRTIDFLFG